MTTLQFDVFGTPAMRVSPQSVVIEEGEGLHDVVTCTLSDFDARKVSAALGLPCRVSCQSGLFSRLFYGYFDTTAPTLSKTDAVGTYYLLGTTSVMRNGAPRVWVDKKPYDIARDLTRPYGLGLEFESYPFTLPFFSQSVESDWQTLQRLAMECGLSLTSNGVVVRFADVLQETRRWMKVSAPVVFKLPAGRSYESAIAATEFTIIDSHTPIGGEQYDFFGVDSFGVSFRVQGGVSTITKHQPITVNSLADAQREARRMESMSRFLTRGVLQAPGDMSVRPGQCVALDDVNGVRTLWYVTSIRHEFDAVTNGYACSYNLCRHDGEGVGYGVPGGIKAVKKPTPTLFGKTWRGDRDWAVEL